jgi:hypothetical protein
MVVEYHTDAASIVSDDFGDEGGRADMKAPVIRNGNGDALFHGITLDHGTAEMDRRGEIAAGVEEEVVEDNAQDFLWAEGKVHLLRDGSAEFTHMTDIVMNKGCGVLHEVVDHADVAAEIGKVAVLSF